MTDEYQRRQCTKRVFLSGCPSDYQPYSQVSFYRIESLGVKSCRVNASSYPVDSKIPQSQYAFTISENDRFDVFVGVVVENFANVPNVIDAQVQPTRCVSIDFPPFLASLPRVSAKHVEGIFLKNREMNVAQRREAHLANCWSVHCKM